MATATRVVGGKWGWGWLEGHGHTHYDWRENCDGGNWPWFVCVFVCVERPQKIRSDLKNVNASIARLELESKGNIKF